MADQPIAGDYPIPGVLVHVFDEASPVRLRVRSSTELLGWAPLRTDSTPTGTGVPTAIEYRGELYAISRRERDPSGWQYDLVAWPFYEPVRRTLSLSRESLQQAQQEKQIERHGEALDPLVRALGIVIALLPAPIQEHISELSDYDASFWTKLNSLAVGLFGLAATLTYLASSSLGSNLSAFQVFLADRIGWGILLVPPYLILDSILRFGNALAGEKPLGLLPLEIAYRVLRRFFHLFLRHPGEKPSVEDSLWLDKTARLGPSRYAPAIQATLPEKSLDRTSGVLPDQKPGLEGEAGPGDLWQQLGTPDRPVEVENQYPGVQVDIFGEASPVPVRVRTATEPIGWTPLVTDPTRAENRQIALTIEYRGALYAIASCERRLSGWQYDLIPWPLGETVRRKIALSHRFWENLEEEKRIEKLRRRWKPLVSATKFLIAFLPSSLQKRIGDGYGYNSESWAMFNGGIIAWMSGVATAYASYARMFDALKENPSPDTSPWVLIVAFPLYVDSLIRFTIVAAGGGPVGFLPLEFVYWIFRSVFWLLGLSVRKKPIEGA